MGNLEQASWPKTVGEAASRLLAQMKDADKATLRAMTEGDLIGLHFSLGMDIRNRFGPWRGNSDLLASCADGAGGFIHPDDASGSSSRRSGDA